MGCLAYQCFGDGPVELVIIPPFAQNIELTWVTLARFAPSVANDPEYIEWEQRYERQAASPAAMRDLLTMINEIDVTDVLPHIAVPTLVLHRTGDPVVPVASARALAAAIPRAQLAESDGCDHFQHIGDIDGWLDALEEFATGLRPRPRTAPAPHVSQPPIIRTLGGFSVEHDGRQVPLTDWGSRRARQLCKRLAAACGAPVPRDELIEMLWSDAHADTARLSARLSVQLSTVRRILNGGVIADRSSVRLDLNAVRVDLADFDTAVYANDHLAVMELYRGPFLPEDVYDDWTRPMRDRAKACFAFTCKHFVQAASDAGDSDRSLQTALRWRHSDPYDEQAHLAVITALATLARHGDATDAHRDYHDRMVALGVEPRAYSEILTSTHE